MGVLIILVISLGILIYLANSHFFSYWSKRGIAYKEPTFLLGVLGEILRRKKSFGEFFQEMYINNKHHELYGFYFSYRPAVTVHDPVLVQDVMIKSFNSFHDRLTAADPETDPLSGNLFMSCGQQWRDLRVKLTPTFTSGKLKGMYPTIRDCAQVLQNYIEKNVESGNDVFDIRDLMARFTTNVISSVAFGIENDAINEPDNIFRKMGVKQLTPSFKRTFVNTLFFFVPNLFKTLNIKVKRSPHEIDEFFMNVVRQTIEYRESNKDFDRKDFMQLMIQLKNQGFVAADKDELKRDESPTRKADNTKKLTFNEVVAQAFLFFVAGFETSSSTSNFCLYELSNHQDIQKKVQDEIDKVMKEANSDEITYEMLNEMKYLECCIDEALRKYPIVPSLTRECSRDHTFSGTNYTIEKGTQVFIPVLGFHRDPEIYENPLDFKPERFLDSSTGNGKSNGLFYLPFGDGPRNCIGARMGKLQTKVGLAMILSKFTFELVDEDLKKNELEFKTDGLFILAPKNNIMLKAKARN